MGCFAVGVLGLGMNLPKSILKISKRLTSPKIPKAMVETIPITLVRDCWKNVVNIKPMISMKIMTPKVISKPNKA